MSLLSCRLLAFRSCKREGCKLYNQFAIDVSVACVISSYDIVREDKSSESFAQVVEYFSLGIDRAVLMCSMIYVSCCERFCRNQSDYTPHYFTLLFESQSV